MTMEELWQQTDERGRACEDCGLCQQWRERSEAWGAVAFHRIRECRALRPEQCPEVQWAIAEGRVAA